MRAGDEGHPVAIVGAGMSGLICARQLRRAARDVVVFDKARGAGGRMATRRAAKSLAGETREQFDHGAQYFTARDQRFAAEVAAWQREGLVSAWRGRLVALEGVDGDCTREVDNDGGRFVGTPRMSALTRHLATGTRLEVKRRVVGLERSVGSPDWLLHDEGGETAGPFSAVVLALPAPQAEPLLADVAPQLAGSAAEVRYAPCWAAMISFEQQLEVDYDGAFVNQHPTFSWVARDASKPRRPSGERWVLHASPEWSREHLELEPEAAKERLLEAFESLVGRELPPSTFAVAHRWRFALPETPLDERCLWNGDARIGACGDWCGGPRVEGAYLSGLAMAEALLAKT